METNPSRRSQAAVEQCVDYLCEQGCVKVSGYIEAMQSGQKLSELAGLSDTERRAVLDELVSIMSVYQGKYSC